MGTSPKLEEINIKPELLEECTDPPKLISGAKGEVIVYIYDIKTAYKVCRDKHKALSTIMQEIIQK